ncbi:MAG TPA: glycoside hydrolase family 2 TIM barrel-domain containing protein [Mucilaginibacter sp.]|jgi:hypothetical protein
MSQLLKLSLIVLVWCLFVSGRQQSYPCARGGNGLVAVEVRNGQYRLLRNGQPYYIKGANIIDCRYLAGLKEAGANSVRIYNTDHADRVLDSAYRLGLTVTISLVMGYADKEMDYNDHKAVAAQLERLKAEVLKYKDHPALLMWGIGNETNLYMGDGPSRFFDHIRLSRAINDVARMIHQADPNHPAVMMVKGGSSNRFHSLFCDQVDLIAYNSFEPIGAQLKKSYWKGPYIISEFGQLGYWASRQTEWYNSIEQTSLRKMQFMQRQYSAFLEDTNNCLGSYAFLWGQKLEYTSTWFSLYTEQGEPTVLTDELKALWTGTSPVKTTSISGMLIDNKPDSANIYLQGGKRYTARLSLTGPLQNDALLRWEVQKDYAPLLSASYGVQAKQVVAGSTVVLEKKPGCSEYRFDFTAPADEGAFRLFLYLKDGQTKVVTANACFYVSP